MAARLGCAIVDANAAADVFGATPSDAGAGLRRWISAGRGQLVSGGKLHEELRQASSRFRAWAVTAQAAAQLRLVDASALRPHIERFEHLANLQSNDAHVLALASVSGARLLYSNDAALQKDFTNLGLINNPRGHVFSTLVNSDFDRQKQELLRKAPPCRTT